MDDKTVYYNSNDANLLYRICTKHGVTPEQAELIAQEYGAAEARSFEGQLKKKMKEYAFKGIAGAVTLGGVAAASWLGLK